MFKNKVLLITGGTGSFGNAMLKGFLNSDLKEIRIFSRDEKKQEDMRIEYKNDKLNFVIGDIRNFNDIRALRAKALYEQDERMTLRKSHENPAVKKLYKDFLEKPGSDKAHDILHTSYVKRKIN